MSAGAAGPCPTCGSPVEGRFCAACGEQRITAHDYSVAHFTEHVVESLTHFDFRSLRAFKVLLLRPGLLTRDYLHGRRKPYVGPIQLFVILNVVFALIGGNTFRTPLAVQEHDQPFRALKQRLVANAIAERGVEREAFRQSFDDAAGAQAKTWIFAMIPLLALCLALLYGFRRFYFEHLIFATHVYAFLLAWMLVAGLVLSWSLRAAGVRLNSQDFDTAVSSIILAGYGVYVFVALRRAYGDGVMAAALRSLAVTLLVFPIILAYRLLLFFVTLASMH